MSVVTRPQRKMLAEIAETKRGVLYVRDGSRWGRTIDALWRRGLVEIVEPDYSSWNQNGWGLTQAGRDFLDSAPARPSEGEK